MNLYNHFHPSVLFLYFVGMLLILMFVFNPILYVVALIGGVLYLLILIPTKKFLKQIVRYLIFYIIVAVANPLLNHKGITVLFFMNGKPVTKESLYYGMTMALMITTILIWSNCYSHIMTSEKFIYLFGRITPKMALVLSMTFRFIPLYQRKMKEIYGYEKANYNKDKLSYADKMILMVKTLSIVLTWSFENAVDTANSMKARGYCKNKRTAWNRYKVKVSDILALIFLVGAVSMIFIIHKNQCLDYIFYPIIIKTTQNMTIWLAYILTAMVFTMPAIIEIEETIRWKYYRLGI